MNYIEPVFFILLIAISISSFLYIRKTIKEICDIEYLNGYLDATMGLPNKLNEDSENE